MSEDYHFVVLVKEAHDLVAADSNGSSDPYVILKFRDNKHATKVQARTLNPHWNETFEIRGVKQSDSFQFVVWDSDTVFHPGNFQTTHSIGKKSHNPLSALKKKVKKKANSAASVFAAADDFLGQCSVSVDRILEVLAANESHIWLPLEPRPDKKGDVVTGELCVSFERRMVDKDQQGIQVTPSLPSKAGVPGVEVGDAAAVSPMDKPKVSVGAMTTLAVEYENTHSWEGYIEALKGPKIQWAGRTTRDVVAIAGESTKATLHIRVQMPYIDLRFIHASFVGKAKKGGSKDKICELHFDILKALVDTGSVQYGTGAGDIAGAAPGTVRFHRGKHSIPFEVLIPQHCPTTFISDDSSVAYKLKIDFDVVFQADHECALEVLVVNLSSTPHGRAPRKFEQTLKLAGSPVKLTLRADKDCAVPLEDVRLEIDVENLTSIMPVRKANVSLHQHLGSISRKISDQKIKFRPPVAKGESRTTTLFFELPSDAPQSFAYMKANCSYELKVKAEVAGRDASVAMALTVQVRDPRVKMKKLPVDKLAKLPINPLDWSVKNGVVWLQEELKLDDVAAFWQTHSLWGSDLAQLFSPRALEPPAQLMANTPDWPADLQTAETVCAALWTRLQPTLSLVFLLKRLHLLEYQTQLVDTLKITMNELPLLRVRDLAAHGIPLGIAQRLTTAVTGQQGNDATKDNQQQTLTQSSAQQAEPSAPQE